MADISHLLRLPQAEAASHLGMSESMLCKRFKEMSKKKWPYRRLSRVEKQIELCRQSGGRPEVLQSWLDEKDRLLQPILIRVSKREAELLARSHDSMNLAGTLMSLSDKVTIK